MNTLTIKNNNYIFHLSGIYSTFLSNPKLITLMNTFTIILLSAFSLLVLIAFIRFLVHINSADNVEFAKLIVKARHSVRGSGNDQILKAIGLLHKALKISGFHFHLTNQAFKSLQLALVFKSLADLREPHELGVEYYQTQEELNEILTPDNAMEKAHECLRRIIFQLNAKGVNTDFELQCC